MGSSMFADLANEEHQGDEIEDEAKHQAPLYISPLSRVSAKRCALRGTSSKALIWPTCIDLSLTWAAKPGLCLSHVRL